MLHIANVIERINDLKKLKELAKLISKFDEKYWEDGEARRTYCYGENSLRLNDLFSITRDGYHAMGIEWGTDETVDPQWKGEPLYTVIPYFQGDYEGTNWKKAYRYLKMATFHYM